MSDANVKNSGDHEQYKLKAIEAINDYYTTQPFHKAH